MPFVKKTAMLALSTALLLSIAPSAFAADATSAQSSVSSSAPGPTAPVKEPSTIAAPTDSSEAVDAKISKESAIELAKKAISLPDGYTLQGINFNSSSYLNGSGAWSVQFEKRNENRSFGNINATIDADTGKLLNYYSYENDPDRIPSYPPRVDLQAAKQLGLSLIQKMHPDLADSLQYNSTFEDNFKSPLNGQVRYSIRYDRTVNGIPFPQNFVEASFDGDGRWIGYEYQMSTKVTFEDTKGVLTPEEAFKQYRTVSNPSLLYVATRPNRNDTALKPVLSYTMPFNLLDAKTGTLIDYNGKPVTDRTTPVPLTDKPLANKPSANQNLSKEQAIAIVTSQLGLPAGAVLQNASYNENVDSKFSSGGGSSWNMSWQVPAEKDKEAIYISATVNSKTGEIMNYYRNQPYYYDKAPTATDSTVSIDTTDKAKEADLAFIKKVLPHYTNELTLDTNNMRPLPTEDMKYIRTYDVSFKRLVNGVETEFESVNVGINLSTGAVENYWNNLSNLTYPNDLGKQIDAERAEELILSQYTLEKRYVLPGGGPGYGGGPIKPYAEPTIAVGDQVEPAAQSAKVVYVATPKNPSEHVFLDALTGEWKSRDTGEITVPGKTVVTDLDGHWAQRELQLMIDYKAIDVKDGIANPDISIKRGEMIKMLIIAMNGGYYNASFSADRKASFADVANGSTYFAYVESAVDANLIDRSSQTFNPESSMSRDEMAELLVRALGYSKLASTPGLFNLNVSDSDSVHNKGHVAIVVSLGIMSATDGVFQPSVEVTRAQAATAFFRYLEKRSALQDSPIRNY